MTDVQRSHPAAARRPRQIEATRSPPGPPVRRRPATPPTSGSKQPWHRPSVEGDVEPAIPLAMHRHVLGRLVRVDVDVDVVDVGDAAGEALVGSGGDLVALFDGGGGVDVDGDVGDEAVSKPADFG